MTIHPTITADRVIEAVRKDDCLGFCTSCGFETSGVEPDARNYGCDNCGSMAVYGAEELMFHLIP